MKRGKARASGAYNEGNKKKNKLSAGSPKKSFVAAVAACLLFCLTLFCAGLLQGCEHNDREKSPAAVDSGDSATALSNRDTPATGRLHETVKDVRPCMGTMVEITAVGRDRPEVREAVHKAFTEIERIETLMSPYREGSDIRRINREAGKSAVKVDDEVMEVLSRANRISEKSNGAFDLTAASLADIWSFDKNTPSVPSKTEIEEALKKVGFRKLVLDLEHGTARLALPGMRIHPGGIAKGYACDRAAAALFKQGITMAMVNAGGDIRVLGQKINRPWKVGVQDPRDRGRIIAWIAAKDEAVATSGDYEKFFVKDGKRYCHILDPRTGRPADSCRSVTVVAKEAWLADALATAVFALGPEEGLELVRSMDAKALIIDSNGDVRQSPGLEDRVHWLP